MEHRKSTFSLSDEDHKLADGARTTLNQEPMSSLAGYRDHIRIQTTETLPANVNTLEEKLEKEVKNFRTLEDMMKQRFSSLEDMIKLLLEFHNLPVPEAVKTKSVLGAKETDVDSRLQTLKMPHYNGEDVFGWVNCAEQCFDANGLTEDEKMVEVTRRLEGKALKWYQQQENRLPFSSWEEFRTCLLGHFQSSDTGDIIGQFFRLTQEGTVMEYQERFLCLSSWVGEISIATLERNFMRGLKSEIREELLRYKPRSLGQMIGLALRIEAKIMAVQGRAETSSDTHNEERLGSYVKYFTKSNSEVHGEQVSRPCSRGKEPAKEDSCSLVARLSLFIVEGSSSNLMILRGAIDDFNVTVVIASGTSHCFISNRVVAQLRIQIKKIPSFTVVDVGTGRIEPCQGLCRGVNLDFKVQDAQLRVLVDLIPFDLTKGVDVILGMTWLGTLGRFGVSLRNGLMVMEFQRGGHPVSLKADPSLYSSVGR